MLFITLLPCLLMASIPAVKALPIGTHNPTPQSLATTTATATATDPNSNPTSPPSPPSCLADFSHDNPSCQLWADTLDAPSSPKLAESWLANSPPWLTALTEAPDSDSVDTPPSPPPDAFSPFISFKKKPPKGCWEAGGLCYQKYQYCRAQYIFCMSSKPWQMVSRYCGLVGEHCHWTIGW